MFRCEYECFADTDETLEGSFLGFKTNFATKFKTTTQITFVVRKKNQRKNVIFVLCFYKNIAELSYLVNEQTKIFYKFLFPQLD